MTAENAPTVPLAKTLPTRPVRASDADRDRVADILREALAEGRLEAEEHAERVDSVYQAKTLGELEPLIDDLPAGQRPGAAHPPGGEPGHSAGAAGGRGTQVASQKNVVAVFSGATRQGRWRVGGTINAVAICGGVELDLTEAVFDQHRTVINVTTVCGGVDIRVPENVTLRSSGSGVLGAFEVTETEAADPDAPVIVIEGVAVFGGVEARPVPGKRVRDLSGD